MGNLYETISALCQQQGIRPGRLCDELGISRGLMTDLKMGRKKSVSAETAQRIASYFGVSVAYLLGQKEADVLVLNGDNAITAGFAGNGSTLFFSRQGSANGAWIENGTILCSGRPVLDTKDILIPGVHNVENYMAAILAVQGLVGDETVRQVAKTFGGVEHRIELVRIRDGVRYYNDSIASSPSRTVAGLRSFREKVILIAGGYDKHIPYDVLGPEICVHVKKLYLNGATAPQIRQAVERCQGEKPEIIDCGDFESAVRAAAAGAEAGDVVLMSPASAAFDQFKNFMVRGNFYKKLIKEM